MENQKGVYKDADEIVYQVNEKDEEIGPVKRQEVRDKTLIHRCTFIFVKNSEDKFWVHKRTMQKAWCPGYYDLAFGGVVDYGEDYYTSAKRELKEEAGLETDITEQMKIYYEDSKSKSFGMVYTTNSDGPLKLQESEVESVHLMSKQEILQKAENQEKIAPDSLKAFKELIKQNKIN
ncbi:NUDIX hydrolase domain protein [Pseudocohnilembus persalinus]|uniref:NUDIX hydrolase domain protein n=1 Tax=Pseudocohnilembus persalinus TaxID=266149 RepID=A0A0V0R444_PSEPJ|nr:NUDIX hydrolase domain protein [Pseudocohnilembus persalinus]|eukprot:KRX08997.1 NUDIX hydrolase domain protein [Pseudocohnilembus persalinus]